LVLVKARLGHILFNGVRARHAASGVAKQSAHENPTTIVSLTFDDGSADQGGLGVLLASHGMRGTFYVNSGTIGKPGRLTWDQLSELAADGNEIAGHTVDHVKLTTVSEGEARRQIRDDREALFDHGFQPTSFAYPYGESNSTIEGIVRDCGYSSGRRAWGLWSAANSPRAPRAELIPPGDSYRIRTSDNPTGDMPLSTICGFISEAENHGGGWVTLVFHQIGETGAAYSTTYADMTALLDWLQARAARGTVVKTVREVIGGPVQPGPG
jgi:peptidoglycan/xylan/chitin deacetylase (PgdA/CDA1 family)